MRISFVSVVLAALTACNNLLDLDPSNPDTDLDGVADPADNCPLDANAQQRDSDHNDRGDVCDCATLGLDADQDGIDDACDDCIGEATGVDSGGDGIDDGCEPCAAATGDDIDADGIDDVCDACTRGPPHDEDGDGVDDDCDNCPTQPNADQTPGTTVLGAACNRGIANWQRFDPLVDQDITLWPGIVAGWTWVDDGLTVVGPTSRTTLVELATSYWVETRGTVAARLSIQCNSPNGMVSCSLEQSTRTLALAIEISIGGNPILIRGDTSGPLPPTGAIRYELRSDAATTQTYCEAFDAAGAVIATAQLDTIVTCKRLKIGSDSSSRLDYLWIVSK